MATVQPQGDDIRKAVIWFSEERKEQPEKNIRTLIDQACTKFDLSPKDAEYLMTFASQEKTG